MHVGVFLDIEPTINVKGSLPHARGGVSTFTWVKYGTSASSPCTWGCFLKMDNANPHDIVFPMHVGVFPETRPRTIQCSGLPHARGGVSMTKLRVPF